MQTASFLAISSYSVEQQHRDLHINVWVILRWLLCNRKCLFSNQTCTPDSANPTCPDSESSITNADAQIASLITDNH